MQEPGMPAQNAGTPDEVRERQRMTMTSTAATDERAHVTPRELLPEDVIKLPSVAAYIEGRLV